MIMTMLAIQVAQIALSTFVIVASASPPPRKGCTAPLILPDKPFFVVWNHPTGSCRAMGVDLNFEKWGIVDNSKDSFIGDEIALFYSLGNWPFYSRDTVFNGGIPQLGNLTSHQQKVKNDIQAEVPSQAFSGLGVIDFESWRPLFALNFDTLKIYQEKSLELAKEKFPHYTPQQLWQEATMEFEQAARPFMSSALQIARQLRPGGRFGYYGYPRCWDENCNGSTVQINDQMKWIYNTSTGLYPSIYVTNNVPYEARARGIRKNILETLRVEAKWAPQDATIFPYALIQDNPYDFYNESGLLYSVREPAEMGSSGVVLWGSSSYMSARNECLALQKYINNTLGPFVLEVTNFFSNCTQQLCQGHGRCIRKDYEAFYQYHLQMSGRSECSVSYAELTRIMKKLQMPALKTFNGKIQWKKNLLRFESEKFLYHSKEESQKNFDNYICRCFAGWSGTHCQHKNKE